MAQNIMTFEVENGMTKAKINGVYMGGGKSVKIGVDEEEVKKIIANTVKPNPQLEGTEPDLTSIELNDEKYKISGGGGSCDELKPYTSYNETPENIEAYFDEYDHIEAYVEDTTLYVKNAFAKNNTIYLNDSTKVEVNGQKIIIYE